MTIYIFAGPSLPKAQRQHWATHATVLPPVAAGDLLRLNTGPGDTVAIVDGFFHQRPAVRHKEILHLLAAGTAVHGAASMGALRSAELAPFGMIGHGRIFRDYRSGAVIADDEVALLHGTEAEEYQPYTEALINIRYALADAASRGELTKWVADTALDAASRLSYVERTRESIVDAARRNGLTGPQCAALYQLICTAPDAKMADALELLAALQAPNAVPVPRGGREHRWQLHETVYLSRWRAAAYGTSDAALGLVPDMRIHALCQALATDYPALREETALRILAATHTHRPGTGDDDDESLRTAALAWLRTLGILAPGAEADPGLDNWCTAAERDLPPAERTVKAAGRAAVSDATLLGPFLEVLRANGAYAVARAHLIKVLRFNQLLQRQHPDVQLSQLRAKNILDWFAARWQVDDLHDAILERGYPSLNEFVAHVRPYYLYDKFHPGTLHLTLAHPRREQPPQSEDRHINGAPETPSAGARQDRWKGMPR